MKERIELWFKLLMVLTVLVCGRAAYAQPELETFLPPGVDHIVIKAEYLADEAGAFSIGDIASNNVQGQWQPVLEDYANFGYRHYPYWYRFIISNAGTKAADQVIELKYPLLDSIDYYRFADNELIEHIHTGDRVPFEQRPVRHPYFMFPIHLEAGERNEIYLRIQTAGSQLVPLNLWEKIPLFVELLEEDQLHAVYFGIVLVIVFFNLLIFVALRERVYLYYAISTLLFMTFFAIMRAKLYPVIFSETPEFHHLLLLLLPGSCLLFSALFTREFLSVRLYSRYLNYLVNGIVLVSLGCIALVFVLDSQASLKLSVLCAIPGTFILLLLGPTLAMMGNPIAWVYTLAWGTFMFGTTVTAMSKQGFLPVSFITEYGMQIGSALEVFILNAALAYRFYREHEDKVAAQEAQLKEHAERREAELKLLDSSMLHPVTMMPNRHCFERQIQEVLGEREGGRVAIVTIEVTRYAEINKTLGHQNTDLLMCEVAQMYNNLLTRSPGTFRIIGPSFESWLCSLDNDSFGFMADAEIAEAHAKDINALIKQMIQPIEFKGMRLELRPVLGVAICPEHGLNAATLLRHARVAADSSDAKERYLSYYRPELDQYNARRLTIISELKDAIQKEELDLYFQPKLDLRSRKIVGVEALIRWNHPKYGLVRPDDFIPMAEQTGIIKNLTRWVIDESLAYLQRLGECGYTINMSINVSMMNLKETDLVGFLEERLAETGLDAALLYLELTETSMMQHPHDAIGTLTKLGELGVKVSVDDFGTGYSSLAYLQDLPANEIKIDKSLIMALEHKETSESVIKSAIDMCHALGFSVVAEGVENEPVMHRLMDMDCDLIQGYFLTPPLPYTDLLEWLRDQETTQRFAS